MPGYETARWLGAKAIFVEREDGAFRLRRGFSIAPGARVLMVEDIITTGLSSRECLEALREHPGTIVGAACLIDRSGGRAEIGVPRIALATLDIPAYSRRRAAAGAGGAAGGEAGQPVARRRRLRKGPRR